MKGLSDQPLELWGGIECTVVRIGDSYRDQLILNGHHKRLSDLDRIAELGVRTLRYPVLWERTAPDGLERANWSWSDARMKRLQGLGIEPIVGLLHHGSGPRHTHLLDPDFPELFAAYARAVAQRYPWVQYYTPINEMLTTARFSGLYGHWYPHAQSDEQFLTILVNQALATQLAMAEIRRIQPAAQLIQTDDLGQVFSTSKLRYQADFENERRWLGWDLLCARVTPEHALWGYISQYQQLRPQLERLAETPCPPNLIGINHYVTSDRYLDHRLELYPPQSHGGNGRDRYADVEALRVEGEHLGGLLPLLRAAWDRYSIPLAVTEVHLGDHEREQVRWLQDVWSSCSTAREEGIDVRAVTAWSLFGSYDWDSLMVKERSNYESGVFDVRSGIARPTALAAWIQNQNLGKPLDPPWDDTPGWWRRADRFIYSCSPAPIVPIGHESGDSTQLHRETEVFKWAN